MTFNQMRYFATICRLGNITKASKALYVSQPALSKSLKTIEKECGTALFVRSGNAISPTDEGLFLLEEIAPILEQIEDMERRIQNHQFSRNYVKISYSALSSFSSYLKILQVFTRDHPELSVRASTNNTMTNFDLLDERKVDLILTSRPQGFSEEMWERHETYQFIPLDVKEQVLCVNKKHPLAGEVFVTQEQLGACDLVLMDGKFSVGRDMARRIREAGGIDPGKIQYTDQIYVAMQLIKKNLACGIFHRGLFEEDADIVEIPCEMGRTLRADLIWRTDALLPWSARAFIDSARQVYGQPKK